MEGGGPCAISQSADERIEPGRAQRLLDAGREVVITLRARSGGDWAGRHAPHRIEQHGPGLFGGINAGTVGAARCSPMRAGACKGMRALGPA